MTIDISNLPPHVADALRTLNDLWSRTIEQALTRMSECHGVGICYDPTLPPDAAVLHVGGEVHERMVALKITASQTYAEGAAEVVLTKAAQPDFSPSEI